MDKIIVNFVSPDPAICEKGLQILVETVPCAEMLVVNASKKLMPDTVYSEKVTKISTVIFKPDTIGNKSVFRLKAN